MPLGLVTNDSLMNKLYDRLVATRNAHISAFTSEDKFSQLRSVCFETLAVVMQSIGKEIIPYAEEIAGYLSSHFPQESKVYSMISFQYLFLLNRKLCYV